MAKIYAKRLRWFAQTLSITLFGCLITASLISFSDRPIGKLTIANQRRRVAFEITDRPSPAIPDAFRFVVTSATDPYAHCGGAGNVLELSITAQAGLGTFEMEISPIIPIET